MKRLQSTLPVFLCILGLSACDLFCDCEDEVKKPCLFSYDSAAFTPDGSDTQLIKPVFEESQPTGTFSATPAGLAIDSLSGEININASQPRTEYTIVFTLGDGTTTCQTKIYIGEPAVQSCELKYPESSYAPVSGGKDVFVTPAPPFNDTTTFKGTFTSSPRGLDIDPATGVFNVNTSKGGVVYTVTFTATDRSTVCQTQVLIQGIDYPDAYIDLSAAPGDSLILPIVDGEPSQGIGGVEYDTGNTGLVIGPGGSINVVATLRNTLPLDTSRYFQEFEVEYFREGYSNSIDIALYWFEDEVPQEYLDFLGREGRPVRGGRLMHTHSIIIVKDGASVR